MVAAGDEALLMLVVVGALADVLVLIILVIIGARLVNRDAELELVDCGPALETEIGVVEAVVLVLVLVDALLVVGIVDALLLAL